MLRGVLIALVAIGFCWTLWSLVSGQGYPTALPGLVWTAIALIALVFERTRYKAILDVPPSGEGWAATGERFVDTRTGREVTVWHQASTGKRAYVGGPAAG
jgi:hypothetical protein